MLHQFHFKEQQTGQKLFNENVLVDGVRVGRPQTAHGRVSHETGLHALKARPVAVHHRWAAAK